LEEIVAAPVYKTEITAMGIRCAGHATPSVRKVGINLVDKRRSLGRYNSLADRGHGDVFLFLYSILSIFGLTDLRTGSN
jgi:hypothetical protein